MIRKYFVYILFIIMMPINSFASDCNFLNKIKIGNSAKDFEKIGLIVGGDDGFGGFYSSYSLHDYCDFQHSNYVKVDLLFLKDKLVQAVFETEIIKDRFLFKLANKNYSANFKSDVDLEKSNVHEYYDSKRSNIQFFYSLIKNQNIEILEMFSIKDGEAIDQYVLKQEMPE